MGDSASPMATMASDMLSGIPADVLGEFNSAADLPDPSPETFEAAADPEPEPESFDTGEPEPETEIAEPEPEPAQAEAKPAATEEELPEGVVAGKNRKGEEGVFVDKKRWDATIYADHKMVRELTGVISEPVTVEAVALRERALRAQESMFSDLESGDQATQGKVIDFIFDQLSEAKQQGRVGVDPSVPLANAFYDRLVAKSPEAYAAVRGRAARDLVKEIQMDAARAGDKELFLSAGHLSRWLAQMPADSDVAAIRATAQRMGIPFHTPEEMDGLKRGVDPNAQLRLENQRLREQVGGRDTTNQTGQYESWKVDTDKAIRDAVTDGAVKPALASIEEAWKPFPKDYNELVVNRLSARVDDALRNNQTLNATMRNLLTQARRAVNPQVREHIAGQITRLYSTHAKLAADANRRDVIEFANNALKGRADATHARRTAASTRTSPQGTTAPVPRSLVPAGALPKAKPGEVFDSNTAYKQAMQLLG